jgi:hypothetical protein
MISNNVYVGYALFIQDLLTKYLGSHSMYASKQGSIVQIPYRHVIDTASTIYSTQIKRWWRHLCTPRLLSAVYKAVKSCNKSKRSSRKHMATCNNGIWMITSDGRPRAGRLHSPYDDTLITVLKATRQSERLKVPAHERHIWSHWWYRGLNHRAK